MSDGVRVREKESDMFVTHSITTHSVGVVVP